MKTDQEIRKGFKVSLNNNTISVAFDHAETDPDDNGRQAELVYGDIMAIQNEHPDKSFNFLVDMGSVAGINYISPKARKVYQNLALNKQMLRAAVVGRSLFLNLIVNGLMHASGKEMSFRWFSKMEEAKNWLVQS